MNGSGDYVLPVLYKDKFIARLEPVVEDNKLVIKKWWWEDNTKPGKMMKKSIRRCLEEFCKYLDLSEVRYDEKDIF